MKMLRKEFDEKYEMVSVEKEYSRFMFIDIFILDGLLMTFVLTLLILREINLLIIIGVILVVIGTTYWWERERRKREILDGYKFMDLIIFCSDGDVSYQHRINKYELLREEEWILINNEFILDTAEVFTDSYDIDKNIFTFIEDTPILTKYGLGKAPGVYIVTTYDGEYELNGKPIPVLMIRLTGPIGMELSK